jgi:hypothetical protein
MSTAGPAGAKVVRPTHVVDCGVFAVEPHQFYRGTTVAGNGNVVCTAAPDASSTTTIIWRYDGGGKYTKYASKNSSQTGTDWWLVAQRGCDASRAFPMHTQIITEFFHGNWAGAMDNSETRTIYC